MMEIEKKVQHLIERLSYIQDIFGERPNENIRLLETKLEDYRHRERKLSLAERRAAILTLEDLFVFVEKKLETELSPMDKVRIVRDGTVIFEGEIASLRRFKDDVKSVKQGYECGIGISGYQDLKVGDTIEGYIVKEVERTE